MINKTEEEIIDIFEYLIEKGCSELGNCIKCPINQKYQKVKQDKDRTKKWNCISACNTIYGLKHAKKQIPIIKEVDYNDYCS